LCATQVGEECRCFATCGSTSTTYCAIAATLFLVLRSRSVAYVGYPWICRPPRLIMICERAKVHDMLESGVFAQGRHGTVRNRLFPGQLIHARSVIAGIPLAHRTAIFRPEFTDKHGRRDDLPARPILEYECNWHDISQSWLKAYQMKRSKP
jgi:hypothetical protein